MHPDGNAPQHPPTDPGNAGQSVDRSDALAKFVSGETTLMQAVRAWLTSYPVKRGWYVLVILILLVTIFLVFRWQGGKLDDMTKDRDKYFNALQPWLAAADGVSPNKNQHEQLAELFAITTNAIAGQRRIEAQIGASRESQEQIKGQVSTLQMGVAQVDARLATMEDKLNRVLQELGRSVIERTKNLNDTLREKFPFGYVLYGSREGNTVFFPQLSTNVLQVTARWERARFTPDYDAKKITVELPQPRWTMIGGPTIDMEIGSVEYSFPIIVGKALPFRILYVPNQPQMHFELLDANRVSPIYVIGFKKPDAP